MYTLHSQHMLMFHDFTIQRYEAQINLEYMDGGSDTTRRKNLMSLQSETFAIG